MNKQMLSKSIRWEILKLFENMNVKVQKLIKRLWHRSVSCLVVKVECSRNQCSVRSAPESGGVFRQASSIDSLVRAPVRPQSIPYIATPNRNITFLTEKRQADVRYIDARTWRGNNQPASASVTATYIRVILGINKVDWIEFYSTGYYTKREHFYGATVKRKWNLDLVIQE